MKPMFVADKADVLVVDDQVDNLHLLVRLLSENFNVHPFPDCASLMKYLDSGRPADIVLLDVIMPDPDGYEICRQLRLRESMMDVPIVFLTGLDSTEDEYRGFSVGATDYISKPFSPPILLARVCNHVRLGRALRLIVNQNDQLEDRVRERTRELAEQNTALQEALHQVALAQDVTIVAFSSLAETRDNETGLHIHRTQNYVRELALELRKNPDYASRLDDETVQLFYKSAPLHDIGKVAIRDHILLKPGRLDPAEFEIMMTHADEGRKAIEAAEANLESKNTFLRPARDIAYCHHEKWDGGGYPRGIAGEEIPLSARLMAVADVYDALTSVRVYKPAFSHEKAVSIILEGGGTHFDPAIVYAFMNIQETFAEIARAFADNGLPAPEAGVRQPENVVLA